MGDKVYDEATKVDAEDGKVVLDGPDGVAVLMTPAAALGLRKRHRANNDAPRGRSNVLDCGIKTDFNPSRQDSPGGRREAGKDRDLARLLLLSLAEVAFIGLFSVPRS